MRRSRLVVATAVAFFGAGPALAEAATCEYSHPDHPSWDFYAACEVSVEEVGGTTTTRAEVANGSRFTIGRVEAAGGALYSVNGLPAERLERGASECLRTVTENEVVCIHPEGQAAPVAAPAVPGPAPAGADFAFGGGDPGFCLLASRENGAETLVDYGACLRRENCLVGAESGEMSCLTDYDWKSGRTTEMARAADWHTLDGAPVTATAKGCFLDDAIGLTFCFSQRAMTADDHPVLAPPPAE